MWHSARSAIVVPVHISFYRQGSNGTAIDVAPIDP
jgi:hypothetical protein